MSSKNTIVNQVCEGVLSDSILDALEDEAFTELPSTQCAFQEVLENAKRQTVNKTVDLNSTPFKNSDKRTASETTHNNTRGHDRQLNKPNVRKSISDQLKKTMLCNAAAPFSVSRAVVMKEAVVSEEISIAMQAMESVSSETTDLGPFFGLPTKVKDLFYKLKGIKSLYGDALFWTV